MASDGDKYRVISESAEKRLNQLGFVIIQNTDLERLRTAAGLNAGAAGRSVYDERAQAIRPAMPDDGAGFQVNWIDVTSPSSPYEVQMDTVRAIYRHRCRGADEWLDGQPPLSAPVTAAGSITGGYTLPPNTKLTILDEETGKWRDVTEADMQGQPLKGLTDEQRAAMPLLSMRRGPNAGPAVVGDMGSKVWDEDALIWREPTPADGAQYRESALPAPAATDALEGGQPLPPAEVDGAGNYTGGEKTAPADGVEKTPVGTESAPGLQPAGDKPQAG